MYSSARMAALFTLYVVRSHDKLEYYANNDNDYFRVFASRVFEGLSRVKNIVVH